MRLKSVLTRFYKSFNYDYLRKYSGGNNKPEWEMIDGRWYPYIEVPIDASVTTVVGANESGKTHLLTAIEKGINGTSITRDDFCRYSSFFRVQNGEMRWPDFGFEWTDLTEAEREKLLTACEADDSPIRSFLLFRNDADRITVYLPRDEGWRPYDVPVFPDILPTVFRLRENVGLPESVPIRSLISDGTAPSSVEKLSRSGRVGLVETLCNQASSFSSEQAITQAAADLHASVGSILSGSGAPSITESELQLARDLILKIGSVDQEALSDLLQALADGRDAFANGIKDRINKALAEKLNFPTWWVQDREFKLKVSPRDYDLVFTIEDRTGTEYSFGERSTGLRYFLSYYVQYRAHEAEPGRSEILLMDEPDAYLSQQGQQDLLKILDAFATGEHGSQTTQVVYVTHSPFLIDRNHAERIRVLEKGVSEEGTRVVQDVSRNHYEPLRSAFGSFVGETTFIGNCNLIVEGTSDQVLIAGASTLLRRRGEDLLSCLDLNNITIVPAGGTSHVPYLVYLARGRDVEKPAVVVLLDSDKAGNDAKAGLARGGAHRKQLLDPKFVYQVGELQTVVTATGHAPIEIEDLIPQEICCLAAQRYLVEVGAATEDQTAVITPARLSESVEGSKPIFTAMEKCLKALNADWHVEKIGFARAVLEVVGVCLEASDSKAVPTDAANQFMANMGSLLHAIAARQRAAERELEDVRVSARVERAKDAFLRDNPEAATREQALLALEDIEASLDNTAEGDKIGLQLQTIRREFQLLDPETKSVPRYPEFRESLDRLKYLGVIAAQETAPQLPLPAAEPSRAEEGAADASTPEAESA